MNTYTAEYRTQSEYAFKTFEADTPQTALEMATQFYHDSTEELCWSSYDEGQPLETITIRDNENDCLAKYYDPEFRKSLFADELLTAAKAFLGHWDKGNLSAAVQTLQSAVNEMEGVES